MRTALLLVAASFLGTACFHESRSYHRDRYEAPQGQSFEAYTTDGDQVVVEQDPRSGYLYIVQPEQLRGQRVAIVDRDEQGRALVTRDVQMHRRYGAERGDGHHDDDRRDDDRR